MKDSSGAGLAGFFLVIVLIYLVIAVLFIVGWVKILQKAGHSGVWVLVGFVPVLNIVMFLVFAFSEWPASRELNARRAQDGYGGGGFGAGGYGGAGYGGAGHGGSPQPYGQYPQQQYGQYPQQYGQVPEPYGQVPEPYGQVPEYGRSPEQHGESPGDDQQSPPGQG